MEESKSRAKDVKKRHWAFVVYPESAPADWLETLQKSGLQGAVSPLHDRDLDPTGEQKKPHWHVIVTYNGPTSFNVVKRITDSLNAPIPQALEAIRGYYRYLTHKDNPEKYQYDEKDIRVVNGFNIADFIEMTKAEVVAIKESLMELIMEKGWTEYADLIEYLSAEHMKPEFDVASSYVTFFLGYLRSRRYRTMIARMAYPAVNPETGEVIDDA